MENATAVHCAFSEGSRSHTSPALFYNSTLAQCQVPYLLTEGQIPVTLSITHPNSLVETSYHGLIYSTLPQNHGDLTFETNPGLSSSSKTWITLSWNPQQFNTSNPSLIYKLILIEFNITSSSWEDKGVVKSFLGSDTNNYASLGSYSGFAGDSTLLKNVNHMHFFHLEAEDPSHPTRDENTYWIPNSKVASTVFFHTYVTHSRETACLTWYRSPNNGPPTDILPCPPTLEIARTDQNFVAAGPTGFFLNYFHSGAEYEFRQRVLGPSGSGQQCVRVYFFN